MDTFSIVNAIIVGIIYLAFGLGIASMVYKDEDVTWSMSFYIFSFWHRLNNHYANGYLYWLLLIALIFLSVNSVIYILQKNNQKLIKNNF